MLMTPIWLGEKSSVCTRLIERMYGNRALLTEQEQYAYYGHADGCLITANEDGAKALRDGKPLLAAAPRLHHPAAG